MTGAYRTLVRDDRPDRGVPPELADTLEAKLALALGPAIRWQLWLFFVPPEGAKPGEGGMSMPCDDLPRRPPPEAFDALTRLIGGVASALGSTELILGLERRGGPDPSHLDREWMRLVTSAADTAGVSVRSVLISHTRGVRGHSAPAVDAALPLPAPLEPAPPEPAPPE